MDELIMILIYAVTVNLMALGLMAADKRKAKKKLYRIPERTFWGLAILGGSLGVFAGMKYFRHKTKHAAFRFGIPFIIIIQAGILIYIYSCHNGSSIVI